MPAPALHILVADDEKDFAGSLQTLLETSGYRVSTAGDGVTALNILQNESIDLAILDIRMPRIGGLELLRVVRERIPGTEAIMLTGVADIRLAVECMTLGAVSYLTKPPSSEELLSLIDRILERKRLLLENRYLRTTLERRTHAEHIIGRSSAILSVIDVAARVAPSDSSVLLQGASGTGKELFASFIHHSSARAQRSFVAVNCAAVPETLLESELFGHEKGAFTDAVTRKEGLVEIADGGTLFLDEIGEMGISVQPKLLRFLQTGEYRRVGGNTTLTADVRLLCATNKDVRTLAASGRFREDLLYRINVITIDLPELRERVEDIPLLVAHILRNRSGTSTPLDIDASALALLREYRWPGNVRELENILERAAILCHDGVIRASDIALPSRSGVEPRSASLLGTATSMREIEKAHIAGVLEIVQWNKTTAADILGMSVKTLYTKIQQYNIQRQ